MNDRFDYFTVLSSCQIWGIIDSRWY